MTGRSEIWQTIHAALQVLWDAESKGAQADDLATAETILSAAEISLPTGNLANGVYDSLGNYYPLPEWVVCDPTNMAVEEHGFQGNGNGDSNGNGSSDGVMPRGLGTAADEGSDSDQVGEKGKAVVDVGEQTAVRVRLSENGRDYQILVHNTDTVGTVTRQVVEVTKVSMQCHYLFLLSWSQANPTSHNVACVEQKGSYSLYGKGSKRKPVLRSTRVEVWAYHKCHGL